MKAIFKENGEENACAKEDEMLIKIMAKYGVNFSEDCADKNLHKISSAMS